MFPGVVRTTNASPNLSCGVAAVGPQRQQCKPAESQQQLRKGQIIPLLQLSTALGTAWCLFTVSKLSRRAPSGSFRSGNPPYHAFPALSEPTLLILPRHLKEGKVRKGKVGTKAAGPNPATTAGRVPDLYCEAPRAGRQVLPRPNAVVETIFRLGNDVWQPPSQPSPSQIPN